MLRRELCTAAVLALTLLLGAVSCGSGHRPQRSGIVVSVDGRVGSLRVDQSDRAGVIAFMGRPDAERHGRYAPAAPYDALGYDCHKKHTAESFQLQFPRPPFCRTIFWINMPTGKFETFYTSESRFVEAHGVRIGMLTALAEQRLHQRLYGGCEDFFLLLSKRARLTINVVGGVEHGERLHIVGGHVAEMVLHSRRRDAGVFDCL